MTSTKKLPNITYLLIKRRIVEELCVRFIVNIFVTTAFFIFLHKAIVMRLLSRENLQQGIVFNAIFHCRLMFLGILILQAWPNEGISQSGKYKHKIPFCKQQ